MSKERYVEHTVALELPIRDSVTKGNYNLADIETKYLPIQTEVVSDNKDKTINKLQQRIAELEEQLKKKPKYNIGDRVYIINEDYEVERDFIESIDIDNDGIEYYTETYSICWYENQLFATKAEAQAKLKELGEKK